MPQLILGLQPPSDILFSWNVLEKAIMGEITVMILFVTTPSPKMNKCRHAHLLLLDKVFHFFQSVPKTSNPPVILYFTMSGSFVSMARI